MQFLAEATQNAGNVMRMAGESEQTMTAAMTAMGVATQKSGSEIGRAARTIQLRLNFRSFSVNPIAQGCAA